MSIHVTPWLVGAAAAVWLGMVAFRTGRNWMSFAILGGLFALVATTFVFGLGEAMSNPFSDHERAGQYFLWTIFAIALVSLVAGLFTMALWRNRAIPAPSAQAGTVQRPEGKPGTGV